MDPAFEDPDPYPFVGGGWLARRWRALAVFDLANTWRGDATADELVDILADPKSFELWWRSVFLRVEVLHEPERGHVGRVCRYLTKGFMPHTFQFMTRIERADPGYMLVSARGDFVGTACFRTFAEDGGHRIEIRWRIVCEKPVLRALSVLIKPLLIANHRYTQRRGRQGLTWEVMRRRGAALPALPPEAMFPHNLDAVRRLYRWKDSVADWPDRDVPPKIR